MGWVRHDVAVSNDRPGDVLGSLPRRRPHRRSDKRARPAPPDASAAEQTAAPASAPGKQRRKQPTQAGSGTRRKRPPAESATARVASTPTGSPRPRPERLRQPAQPPGVPPAVNGRRPEEPDGRRILGTAAKAAAELAEIGLTVSARALRNAVARLPRP